MKGVTGISAGVGAFSWLTTRLITSFIRLRNRWGSLRSPPTYTADGHGTPCPYKDFRVFRAFRG
jgi:hypothetical protein